MKRIILGACALILVSACAKGEKMDVGTYIDSTTVEINQTILDPGFLTKYGH